MLEGDYSQIFIITTVKLNRKQGLFRVSGLQADSFVQKGRVIPGTGNTGKYITSEIFNVHPPFRTLFFHTRAKKPERSLISLKKHILGKKAQYLAF